MVYIFDPTTCEEPKKPTYRYSPIPKAVECSCCPNPADYEGGNETNGTETRQDIAEVVSPLNEPETYYFTITLKGNELVKGGYVVDNEGNKHELTVENGIGKIKTSLEGQYVFRTFTLYEYTDTGDKFVSEGISYLSQQ